MNEPESLRSIARRLIARHRGKAAAREQRRGLYGRESADAMRRQEAISPALRFDIALTAADCAFLHSMRVRAD
jgi:hypothetical protein